MSGPLFADLITKWYELAGVIVAIPAAVATVWAVFRLVGHFAGVNEAIVGRKATPYAEEVPSMIARFRAFDARLDGVDSRLDGMDSTLLSIDSQFHTNGGGTVKDDLKKVQDRLDVLVTGQTAAAQTASDAANELHGN